MKGLSKTLAIVIGLGGAVGLGYLINLALTGIADFSLALIVVVAILFVGGFLLLAACVFLWAKSNGDWDYKPDDTTKTDQTNE